LVLGGGLPCEREYRLVPASLAGSAAKTPAASAEGGKRETLALASREGISGNEMFITGVLEDGVFDEDIAGTGCARAGRSCATPESMARAS